MGNPNSLLSDSPAATILNIDLTLVFPRVRAAKAPCSCTTIISLWGGSDSADWLSIARQIVSQPYSQ